jgi:hypothetical protein
MVDLTVAKGWEGRRSIIYNNRALWAHRIIHTGCFEAKNRRQQRVEQAGAFGGAALTHNFLLLPLGYDSTGDRMISWKGSRIGTTVLRRSVQRSLSLGRIARLWTGWIVDSKTRSWRDRSK